MSFSWVLTVSYQIYTDTAVKTVSSTLNGFLPLASAWLSANIQMVSFAYAFSWIFLLSSIVPALILGKERSVLVQYFVCLTLTVLALSAENLLSTHSTIQTILGASVFLDKPVIAFVYLLIPFVFMISLDARSRWKRSKGQPGHFPNVVGGTNSKLRSK